MVSVARPLASRPAEEAIPILYDEERDRIFRLGLRMLDDPEDAEDLVQETFLLAFTGWDGFEGNSRPSTWLFTIARRAALRMRHRRSGRPRREESFIDEAVSPELAIGESPEDPLEELIHEEESRRLHAALARLPTRYRLPVALKAIDGHSVADVAEMLHVCEGTVKSRLYRGRHELAGLLGCLDRGREADAA